MAESTATGAPKLQADKPVLVDFWAPWCGPCKAIGPLVEKLAHVYGAKIMFAKCNVDNSREVSAHFGIKSIPTLMFFKGGKVLEKMVGMVNPAQLEEALKKIVAGEQVAAPFLVQ